MDVNMLTYIQSENEFSKASHRGFWELVRSLFTQRNAYLLSFNELIKKLGLRHTHDLGILDIPVKSIVGSAGGNQHFTRHFLPRMTDARSKERWRNIYTLAVTGRGFPPIEVYKVGDVYFVEDGHHRVSVASYLGWQTLQAHVTEIPLGGPAEAEFYRRLGWRTGKVNLQN